MLFSTLFGSVMSLGLLAAGHSSLVLALPAFSASACTAPPLPGAVSDAPAPTIRLPERETFLLQCQSAAVYSAKHEGHGVLVLLNGEKVFERFETGWTSATPHPLASGTKSFSGTAAAVAIHDGLLSLDEKVSDTITEWQSDPRKSRVTVRQLLDLSSGLDPSNDTLQPARKRLIGQRGPSTGPKAAPPADDNRAAAAIDTELTAEPGTKFQYGPSNFYVFGELMKRKLADAKTGDADLVSYLNRKVLSPIGATARFNRDRAGNANLPGGCQVSATDWAKFGELIRHKGAHNGKQLIDPDQLRLLFEPSRANASYGLTWWLLRADSETDPEDDLMADTLSRGDSKRREAVREQLRKRAKRNEELQLAKETFRHLGKSDLGVMAAGLGKQRLYILPEFGLTIVRFGDLTGGKRYKDMEFLAMMLEGSTLMEDAPVAPKREDN